MSGSTEAGRGLREGGVGRKSRVRLADGHSGLTANEGVSKSHRMGECANYPVFDALREN